MYSVFTHYLQLDDYGRVDPCQYRYLSLTPEPGRREKVPDKDIVRTTRTGS